MFQAEEQGRLEKLKELGKVYMLKSLSPVARCEAASGSYSVRNRIVLH
jgi:hypothetical protein